MTKNQRERIIDRYGNNGDNNVEFIDFRFKIPFKDVLFVLLAFSSFAVLLSGFNLITLLSFPFYVIGFEVAHEHFLVGLLTLSFFITWLANYLAYKFADTELLKELAMVFFVTQLCVAYLVLGLGIIFYFVGVNIFDILFRGYPNVDMNLLNVFEK